MTPVFYTIGHSTRTLEELAALLRVGGVKRIVDVRAMPRSRANPQFNGDVLPEALAPFDMAYTHSAGLAGLRGRSKTIDDEINGYWHNRSFHNYADYALTEPFQEALAALIEQGRRRVCAIMCSEAVWWRCHRRIIADHLLHRGLAVTHLMNQNRVQPAMLTAGAATAANGDLVYPASTR